MSADPWIRWVSAEGVPSAYAATRDGIDAMLRDRGLRRTTPETTAESLLRGAHASAILEGSTSTLAEVRDSGGDPIAQDAVRLSTELLSMTALLSRSPLQVLARLHTVASAGSLPADERGRPRDTAAAERLHEVARVLVAPTRAPALLVAAMVHAGLVTAAPFPSHNGLVARALERLVIVARGVDEKSLLVPEAGHLALRASYDSHLRGFRDGGEPGVHAWLLYAAGAYAAGAEASPVLG